MALINCAQCKNKVSEWAQACPNCGRQFPGARVPVRGAQTISMHRERDEARASEQERRLRARKRGWVIFMVVLLVAAGLIAMSALESGDAELLFLMGIIAAAYVAIWIYFLPSIVASARGASNRGAVVAVNILLGWTMIGWVVALIMATTSPSNKRPATQTTSRKQSPTALLTAGDPVVRVGEIGVVTRVGGTPGWSSQNSTKGGPRKILEGEIVKVIAKVGSMVQINTAGDLQVWVDPAHIRPPTRRPSAT